MRRGLDMWRCAIVQQTAERISQSDLAPEKFIWLPQMRRFAFRADPFGLWHEGKLHIFVEAFDYRTLRGSIELLVYDSSLMLVQSRIVLSRPWHLSYPFVFRACDEIWMLPEARRSGELTLYRARDFPTVWEPAPSAGLPADALDSTPMFHDGRWWLFYARGSRRSCYGELNVAFADGLAGPWHLHPLNPVRTGLGSTRPAGTPIARPDGTIDLPVQDCSQTYGGSVRRLTIHKLDERHFEAEDLSWLEPSTALSPFNDGLHTLSAAGEVTLIDCKRTDRSLGGFFTHRRGRLARRFSRGSRHAASPNES